MPPPPIFLTLCTVLRKYLGPVPPTSCTTPHPQVSIADYLLGNNDMSHRTMHSSVEYFGLNFSVSQGNIDIIFYYDENVTRVSFHITNMYSFQSSLPTCLNFEVVPCENFIQTRRPGCAPPCLDLLKPFAI